MHPAVTVPAQAEQEISKRKLVLWGALVVVAHYINVIWHLLLLVRVQPSFPVIGIVLLLVINLLPVGGILVFARGLPKIAAGMMVVPLGIALIIGGYSHFLSTGSDNVLHMPPGELTLPFQISSMLLVALEASGCWIGGRAYSYGPTS